MAPSPVEDPGSAARHPGSAARHPGSAARHPGSAARQLSTPRRAIVPAVLAPVVLVGGWTLAAAAQPSGYDSLRDTISALAAVGAPHREIMTVALALLGTAHILTAASLRPSAWPGRAVHALGGVATLGVAAFPQSAEGTSAVHATAATVAFVSLALWPLLAIHRAGPPPFRARMGVAAAGTLSLLVVLFGVALATDRLIGVAERSTAAAQALWPLVAVAFTLESEEPGEPEDLSQPS
jgi:hypothetical membrane protein